MKLVICKGYPLSSIDSAMTASKTHFHITGRLEAYEGDTKILTRQWNRKIKRKLL